MTLSKYWFGKSKMTHWQTGLFSYWLCLDYLLKCRLIRMSVRMSKAALYPQYYTTHMFQPSRFERETPVLRGLSSVLPFDLEISRFDRNMSKFSIFCKNSNMHRKLLRLLVFYLRNCYWQCIEYTVDPC